MKKNLLLFVCLFGYGLYASAQSLPNIIVAGGKGFGPNANQLISPDGIFVDSAGILYVADANNHRIQKWVEGALTGSTVAGGGVYGSAPNQLLGPSDVSVDKAGNVYVADRSNNRIQKWAPGASSGITVAGGNGAGSAANQLNAPNGVAVDASGNLYVADYYNSRIQKWVPGASAGITVAGGKGYGAAANQFSYVSDIFIDATGNIYAVDELNHRVQKWTPGAVSGITVAGGNGSGQAAYQLDDPYRIFVDGGGNLYITDRHNLRVQKWASGAVAGVTVVKGFGGEPYNTRGPDGIFVDAKGNIYVSDAFRLTVQKFPVDISPICPDNLVLTLPECNAKVAVNWAEPRDTFPTILDIPARLDPYNTSMNYFGKFEGHGYYRSLLPFLWPVAMDVSRLIGGTDVKSYLTTINSPAENEFFFGKLKNSGFSPWIGLHSFEKPGEFRWANGEEPGYTNWSKGEPNNAGGNTKKIREPYVRMMDGSGTWNDQNADNVAFIAEFEKPFIHYSQISGPKNGSELGRGFYQVCYERTNLVTEKVDTCCFSVIVNCSSTLAENAQLSKGTAESIKDDKSGLRVLVSPNPTSSTFNLQVFANNNYEKIMLQLSDINGRIIESRTDINSKQVLSVGKNLKPGVYFASVVQGDSNVAIKLIKQ